MAAVRQPASPAETTRRLGSATGPARGSGDGAGDETDGGAGDSGRSASDDTAGGGQPTPPQTGVSHPGRSRVMIAEFRLKGRLGGGSFGVVYRAWDTTLHRHVAVKLFAPAPGRGTTRGGGEVTAPDGGPVPLDPVLHEARAQARLDHPHIVPVVRAATVEFTAPLRALLAAERPGEEFLPPAGPAVTVGYIVSKLVTGGTLQDRFGAWTAADAPPPSDAADRPADRVPHAGGPPAWATPAGAVRFMLPLADALAHAHRHGVVHRDFKPGNVLLRPDGAPTLTDFGIARAAPRPISGDASTVMGGPDGSGTLSGQGRLLGTPAYMAPEQAVPWREVGPPADVFAFGIVLWELLAGRRMYRGEAAEILEKIANDPPPPLPAGVPAGLRVLVERCLSKAPADRPRDGGALAAELRSLPGILAAPAGGGVSRRAAATGLLTAAGIAAAGWWAGRPTGRRIEDEAAMSPTGPPAAGLKRVEIATDPRGATAWLFPLDAETGLPAAAERIDLPGPTPGTVDVPPGPYLVVAEATVPAAEGGEPRRVWHEVVRHVPGGEQGPHAPFPAFSFAASTAQKAVDGPAGRVLLAPFRLFETAGLPGPDLVPVPPSDVSVPSLPEGVPLTVEEAGTGPTATSPGAVRYRVPEFDAVAGPLRFDGGWVGRLSPDLRRLIHSERSFLSHLAAAAVLEQLGLRLPTDPEWAAVTAAGFGPTAGDPFEWLAVPGPSPSKKGKAAEIVGADWTAACRLARGVRTDGDAAVISAPAVMTEGNLSARGVRSRTPRREAADFDRQTEPTGRRPDLRTLLSGNRA